MSEESEEEYETWISSFCQLYTHEYFVEVPQEFIEDEFNLTGLSSIIPYYRQALDLILDFESEEPVSTMSDKSMVQQSASLLYGLIHQRFILTKQGLHLMNLKYEKKVYGQCPRFHCNNTSLIPVGLYDHPAMDTVKLFCSNCSDLYLPSSSRYLNIDGSFFGTSFCGLFQRQYGLGKVNSEQFRLKIFGFAINEASVVGGRMKWLRQVPGQHDEHEFNSCEFGIAESDDDDVDMVSSSTVV